MTFLGLDHLMNIEPPRVIVIGTEELLLDNCVRQIQLLLQYVPSDHLVDLKEIVLTTISSLSRKRRRQKSASGSAVEDVHGLYHESCDGNSAWIEIFVDKTFSPFPVLLLKIPFFRNYALAQVLFHEIGHHVHAIRKKAKNDKEEEFANRFESKLSREFMYRHYWYLRPIFAFLRLINKILSRMGASI